MSANFRTVFIALELDVGCMIITAHYCQVDLVGPGLSTELSLGDQERYLNRSHVLDPCSMFILSPTMKTV